MVQQVLKVLMGLGSENFDLLVGSIRLAVFGNKSVQYYPKPQIIAQRHPVIYLELFTNI